MIDPVSILISPLTYRSFLIASILVLMVMTLILLLAMIAHKNYVEIRDSRSARIKKKYGTILSAFLDERRHLIAPRTNLAVDALADATIELIPGLDAEAMTRVRDELKRIGVLDALIGRALSSRSWVTRHRALERLGFLRLPEFRQTYLDLIRANKDSRIVSKALWALSYVAEEDDLLTVLAALGDTQAMSAKFNEYLFTNIISEIRNRLGDTRAAAILEKIFTEERHPLFLKRDIMEACGRLAFIASESVIIDAFHRYGDRPEIRITALRALGEMASGQICDLLVGSLGDTDWRVRLTASRYAHLCPERSLARLESLLEDNNYHVRLNAAQTLASLGAPGRAALERARRGRDRFARDVSIYLLSGGQP